MKQRGLPHTSRYLPPPQPLVPCEPKHCQHSPATPFSLQPPPSLLLKPCSCSVFSSEHQTALPLLHTELPKDLSPLPAISHHCRTAQLPPQNPLPMLTSLPPLLPTTSRETSVRKTAINRSSQLQNQDKAHCS